MNVYKIDIEVFLRKLEIALQYGMLNATYARLMRHSRAIYSISI